MHPDIVRKQTAVFGREHSSHMQLHGHALGTVPPKS